jgi:hypothetical protein
MERERRAGWGSEQILPTNHGRVREQEKKILLLLHHTQSSYFRFCLVEPTFQLILQGNQSYINLARRGAAQVGREVEKREEEEEEKNPFRSVYPSKINHRPAEREIQNQVKGLEQKRGAGGGERTGRRRAIITIITSTSTRNKDRRREGGGEGSERITKRGRRLAWLP